MKQACRKLRHTLTGAAVAAMLPWAAGAQTSASQTPQPSAKAAADASAAAKERAGATPARSDTYGNVRLNELTGMDVRDSAGRRIGDVEDVVIDTSNGEIRYAVLAFGGFMGMGERLYAYPTSALAVNLRSGTLTLNVPADRLKSSEGFNRDQWPDDASFWDRVERFFTAERRPANPAQPHLVRASRLLDMDVNDRNGDDIGEIHDVVVNLGQRNVMFVVLEFDQAWNPVDKLVAVPMKAFQPATARTDELVLERERETLREAPSFDRARWPELTQGGFGERYRSYWNNAPTPAARPSATFQQLDRDGNGVLTAQEFSAASPAHDAGAGGAAGSSQVSEAAQR